MKPLVEVNEKAATPKKKAVAAKNLDKSVLADLVKKDSGQGKKTETPPKKLKETAKMEAKENVIQQSKVKELSPKEKLMVSNMAMDPHLTSVVRNYGEKPVVFALLSSQSGQEGRIQKADNKGQEMSERDKTLVANMAKDPHLTSVVRNYNDCAPNSKKEKEAKGRKEKPAKAKPKPQWTHQDSASTSSSKAEKKKNYWKERKAKEKAQKEDRKTMAQEEKRAKKKEKRRQRRLAENKGQD